MTETKPADRDLVICELLYINGEHQATLVDE